MARDFQIGVRDGHVENLPPIVNAGAETVDFLRQEWVEVDGVRENFHPRVAALNELDSPCHGAQMDTLRRGAALKVRKIRVEGLFEQTPRPAAIPTGQDPGVRDPTQGRA